jgi:hypothetical protein
MAADGHTQIVDQRRRRGSDLRHSGLSIAPFIGPVAGGVARTSEHDRAKNISARESDEMRGPDRRQMDAADITVEFSLH